MPTTEQHGYFLGTGRRKSSVARARIKPSEGGKITINGKDHTEYFSRIVHQRGVTAPFEAVEQLNNFEVIIRCNGGGGTGQSGACKLAIARALKNFNEEFEPALREAGLLTRDSRMVERKKPGLKGARGAFQFSKR